MNIYRLRHLSTAALTMIVALALLAGCAPPVIYHTPGIIRHRTRCTYSG